MDQLIVEMRAQDMRNRINNWVFTVLTRGEGSDGKWHTSEIGKIIHGLMTESHHSPALPQFLILDGEFTKSQVLEAMGGGQTFTAEVVVGLNNAKLPFRPNLQIMG